MSLKAKALWFSGAMMVILPMGFAKGPDVPVVRTATKKSRLIVISSTEGEPYKTTLDYFNKQLKSRGWSADKNLEVLDYYIGNHEHTVANIWNHVIKKEGADVVYVAGTTAGIGAKLYLMDKNIKIVFSDVTDPVGVGLIDSFKVPPKAEVTGVCFSVAMEEKLRFIKSGVPNLKKIGYIYADMPSSRAYLGWLKAELEKPEFKDLSVVAEKIPFVGGEGGYIRMSQMAEDLVKKMDSQVDVFMSPSDSLGGQELYVRTLARLATKPLIGIQELEVVNHWGAAASIHIPADQAGGIAADMVADILSGKNIRDLIPQCPKAQIVVDNEQMQKHHLQFGKLAGKSHGPRRGVANQPVSDRR